MTAESAPPAAAEEASVTSTRDEAPLGGTDAAATDGAAARAARSRYGAALNEALAEEMHRDPAVFCIGEDIADLGTAAASIGVTRGLVEGVRARARARHAGHRRRRSSRPECRRRAARPAARSSEIMYSDFLTLAMDPIVNQAAKMRYMFGGQASVPMVVRTNSGAPGSKAAQHSQSLEALVHAHPGPQGRHARHPARRQGPAQVGDPRRRPGDLPRAQAPVRDDGPVPTDDYRSRSASRRSADRAGT